VIAGWMAENDIEAEAVLFASREPHTSIFAMLVGDNQARILCVV
jgi:hypothetical protein